jgi:hypothetical protein
MVIVSTPDAVMVIPEGDVQDVKEIVKYLRCHGQERLL